MQTCISLQTQTLNSGMWEWAPMSIYIQNKSHGKENETPHNSGLPLFLLYPHPFPFCRSLDRGNGTGPNPSMLADITNGKREEGLIEMSHRKNEDLKFLSRFDANFFFILFRKVKSKAKKSERDWGKRVKKSHELLNTRINGFFLWKVHLSYFSPILYAVLQFF